MTPFKDKDVKWDGNDEGGRYINEGGFKFDIITSSIVSKTEPMPENFLADTPEEAESIYAKFNGVINKLASSYAASTGLSKSDIFGEALIGLARAYRDWNPLRSDNFRVYALFRIKDAIREFVRNSKSVVSAPDYVKKAFSNLKEIVSICEKAGISPNRVICDQELPIELEPNDALRCYELINNLIKASERAKVDYSEFVERIKLMPTEEKYEDLTIQKESSAIAIEAALLVKKLKQYMDKDELTICEGIMADKSYEEIGKGFNKSKTWVHTKMENLRNKILKSIKSSE